jgi:beta-glucanase (GH16 family)
MKTNIVESAIKIAMLAIVISSCSNETLEQDLPISNSGAPGLKFASAWERVFTDNFDNNANLSQWTAAARFDYNSKVCKYLASVPHIATCEGLSCLELTATKNGAIWNSGFLTSNFSFKPAKNEEYRTSAYIKFTAVKGGNFVDFSTTYGAWPAFWTVQGNRWPTYGEIDIVEAYTYGTYARFASNLFYGKGRNVLGTTCERAYSATEGWHLYDEYWANNNGVVSVTIQLDGEEVASYTNASNPKLLLENFGPHTIMLNLNVGDNYGIFNNSLINVLDKTMMWVDYVTVDKRTL